jgi:CRISPR-associated endonuclease Cas3-HD
VPQAVPRAGRRTGLSSRPAAVAKSSGETLLDHGLAVAARYRRLAAAKAGAWSLDPEQTEIASRLAACHDLGKAARPWQAWARAGFGPAGPGVRHDAGALAWCDLHADGPAFAPLHALLPEDPDDAFEWLAATFLHHGGPRPGDEDGAIPALDLDEREAAALLAGWLDGAPRARLPADRPAVRLHAGLVQAADWAASGRPWPDPGRPPPPARSRGCLSCLRWWQPTWHGSCLRRSPGRRTGLSSRPAASPSRRARLIDHGLCAARATARLAAAKAAPGAWTPSRRRIAARLAACHDLGKAARPWQAWARAGFGPAGPGVRHDAGALGVVRPARGRPGVRASPRAAARGPRRRLRVARRHLPAPRRTPPGDEDGAVPALDLDEREAAALLAAGSTAPRGRASRPTGPPSACTPGSSRRPTGRPRGARGRTRAARPRPSCPPPSARRRPRRPGRPVAGRRGADRVRQDRGRLALGRRDRRRRPRGRPADPGQRLRAARPRRARPRRGAGPRRPRASAATPGWRSGRP